MALDTYTFDISGKKWVRSFDEPSEVGAPTFGNTDARDFEVQFIRRSTTTEVEVVQSVVSAQIALSNPSTPGTVMTSATASTAVNNKFPFVLNISGSAITTFMSGVTEPKKALCEFRIATASGVNRYQTYVFIAPNQTTDATADPAAADRALGANEAAGIYVPKEWPAGMRMLMTTDSGRRFLFYPHDDGSFRGDEI